ncbi:hypothetical protein M409DRAFT_51668 [Zasmidium cellare ATCC 36951]|uniref:Uncharacterized protein n=1 Tax=Zasmidium cellare ATCC 36951 TaxID=1080233 RepID=A0A6A6CUF0_ZASCE|nr:uncharacterized protein M409DRAFT_51668 [Zasmidium cellare ATCC 36951]KAF2170665.1 hypothetical protein M409DRAFT_51668 [Zasmidium cellare ATCC 36951]
MVVSILVMSIPFLPIIEPCVASIRFRRASMVASPQGAEGVGSKSVSDGTLRMVAIEMVPGVGCPGGDGNPRNGISLRNATGSRWVRNQDVLATDGLVCGILIDGWDALQAIVPQPLAVQDRGDPRRVGRQQASASKIPRHTAPLLTHPSAAEGAARASDSVGQRRSIDYGELSRISNRRRPTQSPASDPRGQSTRKSALPCGDEGRHLVPSASHSSWPSTRIGGAPRDAQLARIVPIVPGLSAEQQAGRAMGWARLSLDALAASRSAATIRVAGSVQWTI